MQLVFSKEPLSQCQEELDKLIHHYWYLAPENKGSTPLNINWSIYKALDATNVLHIYVARDLRDKMLGAALYLVVDAPHHIGHKVAECDTLFTDHNYRGLGIAKKLMKFAEPLLMELGVDELFHRFRLVFSTRPLFPALGYEPFETVYHKKVT